MADINFLNNYLFKKSMDVLTTDPNIPFYNEPIKGKDKFLTNLLTNNVEKSLKKVLVNGIETDLRLPVLDSSGSWSDSVDYEPSKFSDGKTFYEKYPELNLEFYKNLILSPINNTTDKVWTRYDDASNNVLSDSVNYIHAEDDSYLPIVKYYNTTTQTHQSVLMNTGPLFWLFDDVNGALTLFATSVPSIIEANPLYRTSKNSPIISFFKYRGNKGFANLTIQGDMKIPDIGVSFDKIGMKTRDINISSGEYIKEITKQEKITTTSEIKEMANLKWEKNIDGFDEKSNSLIVDSDNNLIVSNSRMVTDVFNRSELPKLIKDLSSNSRIEFVGGWNGSSHDYENHSFHYLNDGSPYNFGSKGFYNDNIDEDHKLKVEFGTDQYGDYLIIKTIGNKVLRTSDNLSGNQRSSSITFSLKFDMPDTHASKIYFKKSIASTYNNLPDDATFDDVISYFDNNYFYFNIPMPHFKIVVKDANNNDVVVNHYIRFMGGTNYMYARIIDTEYETYVSSLTPGNSNTGYLNNSGSLYSFSLKIPINKIKRFQKYSQILQFNDHSIDYINTFISKYNPTGSLLNEINVSKLLNYKSIAIQDMVVDDNNNIYVGGYTFDNVDTTNTGFAKSTKDLLLLKYDNDLVFQNKFQLTDSKMTTNPSNYDLSGNEENINLYYHNNELWFSFNTSSKIDGNTFTDLTAISKIENTLTNYTNNIFYDLSHNIVKKVVKTDSHVFFLLNNRNNQIAIDVNDSNSSYYKNLVYSFSNSNYNYTKKIQFSKNLKDIAENITVNGNFIYICGSVKSQASALTGVFSGLNFELSNFTKEYSKKENEHNAFIMEIKIDDTEDTYKIFWKNVYSHGLEETESKYTDVKVLSNGDICAVGYKIRNHRKYAIVHKYHKNADYSYNLVDLFDSDEYFDAENYILKKDANDNLYVYGLKKDQNYTLEPKKNTFLFKVKFENVTKSISNVTHDISVNNILKTDATIKVKMAKEKRTINTLENLKTEWGKKEQHVINSANKIKEIGIDLKFMDDGSEYVYDIYKQNKGVDLQYNNDQGNEYVIPSTKYALKYPLTNTFTSKTSRLKFKLRNVYYEDGKTQFQIMTNQGPLCCSWMSGYVGSSTWGFCIIDNYEPHTFYTENEIHGKECNTQEYNYITDYNVSEFYKNKRIVEYEIRKPYTLLRGWGDDTTYHYASHTQYIKMMMHVSSTFYTSRAQVNDNYYHSTFNSLIVRVAIDKNLPYIPKLHELFKNYNLYIDSTTDSNNNIYVASIKDLGSPKLYGNMIKAEGNSVYTFNGFSEIGFSNYTLKSSETDYRNQYIPAGINVESIDGNNTPLGKLTMVTNVNSGIKNLSTNPVTDPYRQYIPIYPQPLSNPYIEWISGDGINDDVGFKFHSDNGCFIIGEASSTNNDKNSLLTGHRMFFTKIKSLSTTLFVEEIIKDIDYSNQCINYDLSGVYYMNGTNKKHIIMAFENNAAWFYTYDKSIEYTDLTDRKVFRYQVPWDLSNNAINSFSGVHNTPSFLEYIKLANARSLQSVNIKKYNNLGVLDISFNKYLDLNGNICNDIKIKTDNNDDLNVVISGKKSIRDFTEIDLNNNVLDFNSEIHSFKIPKENENYVITNITSNVDYAKYSWENDQNYMNKYILHIEGEVAANWSSVDWAVMDKDGTNIGPYGTGGIKKNPLSPNGALQFVFDGNAQTVTTNESTSGNPPANCSHHLITQMPGPIIYYKDNNIYGEKISGFSGVANNVKYNLELKDNIQDAITQTQGSNPTYTDISTNYYTYFEEYYPLDTDYSMNVLVSDNYKTYTWDYTFEFIKDMGREMPTIQSIRENKEILQQGTDTWVPCLNYDIPDNRDWVQIGSRDISSSLAWEYGTSHYFDVPKLSDYNSRYPQWGDNAQSHHARTAIVIGNTKMFGKNFTTTHSGVKQENSPSNEVIIWRQNKFHPYGVWKFHQNTVEPDANNSVLFKKRLLIEISGNIISPEKFYINSTLFPIYTTSGSYGPDDIFKIKLINISQDIGETKINKLKHDSNNNLIIVGNKEIKHNTHNKPKTHMKSFVLKLDNTNSFTKYDLPTTDYINRVQTKINNYSMGLDIDISDNLYISGIKENFSNNYKKYFLFDGKIVDDFDSITLDINENIDEIFDYAYNHGWNFVSLSTVLNYKNLDSILLSNFENYKNVLPGDFIYYYTAYGTLIAKIPVEKVYYSGTTMYIQAKSNINNYNFLLFGWGEGGTFWFKNVNSTDFASRIVGGTGVIDSDLFFKNADGTTSQVSGSALYSYGPETDNNSGLITSSGGIKWFATIKPIKQHAILYKNTYGKFLSHKINERKWAINNDAMWSKINSDDTVLSDRDNNYSTYFIGLNDSNSNRFYSEMDLGLKINKSLYVEKYSLSSNSINKEWSWSSGYKNDKIHEIDNNALKLDSDGNILSIGSIKNTQTLYGKYNTLFIDNFDFFPKNDKNKFYGEQNLYYGEGVNNKSYELKSTTDFKIKFGDIATGNFSWEEAKNHVESINPPYTRLPTYYELINELTRITRIGGNNSDTWIPMDYGGAFIQGYWMQIGTHSGHYPGKISVPTENNSWGISNSYYTFKTIIYYVEEKQAITVNHRKNYITKITDVGEYDKTITWHSDSNSYSKELTIDNSQNIYVSGHKNNNDKQYYEFPNDVIMNKFSITKISKELDLMDFWVDNENISSISHKIEMDNSNNVFLVGFNNYIGSNEVFVKELSFYNSTSIEKEYQLEDISLNTNIEWNFNIDKNDTLNILSTDISKATINYNLKLKKDGKTEIAGFDLTNYKETKKVVKKGTMNYDVTVYETASQFDKELFVKNVNSNNFIFKKDNSDNIVVAFEVEKTKVRNLFPDLDTNVYQFDTMIVIIKYTNSGLELWKNYIYPDNGHKSLKLFKSIDFDEQNNIFISTSSKPLYKNFNIINVFKLNSDNNQSSYTPQSTIEIKEPLVLEFLMRANSGNGSRTSEDLVNEHYVMNFDIFQSVSQAASQLFTDSAGSFYFQGGTFGDHFRINGAFDWHTNTDDDFTIELWFKSTNETGTRHIISMVDEKGTNVLVFGRSGSNYSLFSGGLNTPSVWDSNNSYLNDWTHLAIVQNYGGLYLYINGRYMFHGEKVHVPLSECKLLIGADLDRPTSDYQTGEAEKRVIESDYFEGYIQQIMIFRYARYVGISQTDWSNKYYDTTNWTQPTTFHDYTNPYEFYTRNHEIKFYGNYDWVKSVNIDSETYLNNILYMNDCLYASVYTNRNKENYLYKIDYTNTSNILCNNINVDANYNLFVTKDSKNNIVQYGHKIEGDYYSKNIVKTSWNSVGSGEVYITKDNSSYDLFQYFPGIDKTYTNANLSKYSTEYSSIVDADFNGTTVRAFQTVGTGSVDSGGDDADGGFNISYKGVGDKNKMYMFSIFVRRISGGDDGYFYFGTDAWGTQSVSRYYYLQTALPPHGATVNKTKDTNPYFDVVWTDNLDLNDWHMTVGFIYPTDEIRNVSSDLPTRSELTGTWKVNSFLNKIRTNPSKITSTSPTVYPQDFVFMSDSHNQLRMRSYLFYDGTDQTNLQFYKPSIFEIEKRPDTLQEIYYMMTRDRNPYIPRFKGNTKAYMSMWNGDLSANKIEEYNNSDTINNGNQSTDVLDVDFDETNNVYAVMTQQNNQTRVVKFDGKFNVLWDYRNVTTNNLAETNYGFYTAYNIKLDSKNNVYVYGGDNDKLNIIKMNERGGYENNKIIDAPVNTINDYQDYSNDDYKYLELLLRAEENTGYNYVDLANNHTDVSGGTTVAGTAQTQVESYPFPKENATAFIFNGSNDYVAIDSCMEWHTDLRMPFTIEFWMINNTNVASSYLSHDGYVIGLNSQSYNEFLLSGTGAVYWDHSNLGTIPLENDVWMHIAIVYEWRRGLFIYKNGANVLHSSNNLTRYLSPCNFTLAADADGSQVRNQHWGWGNLQEVMIFRKARYRGTSTSEWSNYYENGNSWTKPTSFYDYSRKHTTTLVKNYNLYSNKCNLDIDNKDNVYLTHYVEPNNNYQLIKYPSTNVSIKKNNKEVDVYRIENVDNVDLSNNPIEKWTFDVNDENKLNISLSTKNNQNELNEYVSNDGLFSIDKNGNTEIKGGLVSKKLNIVTDWKKSISFIDNKLKDLVVDGEGNITAIYISNSKTHIFSENSSDYPQPHPYLNDDYYSGVTPYYSAIVKYDRKGKIIWNKLTPITEFDDIAESVSTDMSNNLYVVGFTNGDIQGKMVNKEEIINNKYEYYHSTTLSTDYNYVQKTSGTNKNVFVVKYDAKGNKIWSNQLNNHVDLNLTNDEIVTDTCVDKRGNLFVSVYQKLNSKYQSFIIKYDSHGKINNVILVKDDNYNMIANGICLDNKDNVYLVGIIGNVSFIFKYSNSLNITHQEFIPFRPTSSAQYYNNEITLNRVCFDNHNAICVVGSNQVNNKGNVYVCKYDLELNNIWSKTIGKKDLNECGIKIICDKDRNIYIGGVTSGNTYGNLVKDEKYYYDFMITKLSKDGIEYDEMKKQFGYKITKDGFCGFQMDAYGDIYIAGYGKDEIGGNNAYYLDNGFILKYKNKTLEKCKNDDWNIKLNDEEQLCISYDNEDKGNSKIVIDKRNNLHLCVATDKAVDIGLVGWYSNSHIDRSGYNHNAFIVSGDYEKTYYDHIDISNNKYLDLYNSGIMNAFDKTKFSFSANYNIKMFGEKQGRELGLMFMRLTKKDYNHGINLSGYYNEHEDSILIFSVLNFEDDLEYSANYKYRQNVVRYDDVTSNLKLKANQWFNITCVVNLYETNTHDKIKLYINGERIINADTRRDYGLYQSQNLPRIQLEKSIETYKKSITSFRFGQGSYSGSYSSNGVNMKMSNVMVFNKLLNQKEISDIYKTNRLKYWLTPYGYTNKAEVSSFNPAEHYGINGGYNNNGNISGTRTAEGLDVMNKWYEKCIKRTTMLCNNVRTQDNYIYIKDYDKDIFTNEYVLFMKIRYNMYPRDEIAISDYYNTLYSLGSAIYPNDGYDEYIYFSENSEWISFHVNRVYKKTRLNHYKRILKTGEEIKPFMHNGFFEGYLVGKFLDKNISVIIYDRKGINKIEIKMDIGTTGAIINLDDQSVEQLSGKYRPTHPHVEFGKTALTGKNAGGYYTLSSGEDPHKSNGWCGTISNIMVFNNDLTENEIRYMIYQPDYTKLNEDIMHNNIVYKSPVPGFKWKKTENSLKTLGGDKDYEYSHGNFNSNSYNTSQMTLTSKHVNQLKLISHGKSHNSAHNLFIMEGYQSAYRGQGTVIYSHEIRKRLFYGNHYGREELEFNISFQDVEPHSITGSFDRNKIVLSVNKEEVFIENSNGMRIETTRNDVALKLKGQGQSGSTTGITGIGFSAIPNIGYVSNASYRDPINGTGDYEDYGSIEMVEYGKRGKLHFKMRTTDYYDVKPSTVMMVNYDGKVGIGKIDPKAMLHIASNTSITDSKDLTNNTIAYLRYDATTLGVANFSTNASYGVSLWCDGMIFSEKYIAASDSRIKKDIIEINDEEALIKLRNINCYSYYYIDGISRTSKKQIGFIAQQVKEHLPEAVSIINEIIPNEFKELENMYWRTEEDKFKLSHRSFKDISNVYYKFICFDENMQSSSLEVIGNFDNTFTFDKQWNRVFLYGKRVDDFHALDKQKLFALNFSATQELDRKQQETKVIIERLLTENQELKTKNEELENKYTALETRISALENV